jgi:UDP-N-acetyl-D-glucosamine dehydrogenase
MQDRHPAKPGRWSISANPESLANADIIVVAVRLPVSADGLVDREPLDSAADLLRDAGLRDRMILLASTVPCGTTRTFAETLGGGGRTLVAHAPERLSAGQDRTVLRQIPHLVGGLGTQATEAGARFLGTFCDQVVPVSSPEVSELSKLLENAFISTGVALANEITRLAHSSGISATEVCQAAATKTQGYFPFYPGPGVGGHCLPNDLQILAGSARARGLESPLFEAVAAVNDAAPEIVVNRLEAILESAGSILKRARVLLVGVGFKIGSSDTTATPAVGIVRLLRRRGASPAFVDSAVPDFAVDGQAVERVDASALKNELFDACIVMSGDRSVTGRAVESAANCVLDAGGARILHGSVIGAHRL